MDPEKALFFVCLMILLAAVVVIQQLASANRGIEKMNRSLQVFWEEYVRRGGCDR